MKLSNYKNMTDEFLESMIWAANPHIQHFRSSIYGYAVMTLKHDIVEWDVYHIDKYQPPFLGLAPKRQVVKATYDPVSYTIEVNDKL